MADVHNLHLHVICSLPTDCAALLLRSGWIRLSESIDWILVLLRRHPQLHVLSRLYSLQTLWTQFLEAFAASLIVLPALLAPRASR